MKKKQLTPTQSWEFLITLLEKGSDLVRDCVLQLEAVSDDLVMPTFQKKDKEIVIHFLNLLEYRNKMDLEHLDDFRKLCITTLEASSTFVPKVDELSDLKASVLKGSFSDLVVLCDKVAIGGMFAQEVHRVIDFIVYKFSRTLGKNTTYKEKVLKYILEKRAWVALTSRPYAQSALFAEGLITRSELSRFMLRK
ncbi:hypothetical protein [Candidatus Synchoanobacter obligatus]|uniref:Uncharacterized protein n=1 Tax=Candidatus Synchoanobacter obligatus TaxID=2919597 RepID=A0ABT1L4H4_9GAMM|nr:hypothetical protein [Candidatus Synchoanobacter obligatus]MCP8352067.1 hypothetical protein [Candidatus Synchoanobacter obligatus]